MCLAIPGRIAEILDEDPLFRRGRVAFGGVTNRRPRDLEGRILPVLFTATFTTRDQRPPQLLSFTPENGTVQVDVTTGVRLTFDEPVASGAVITLVGPGGTAQPSSSRRGLRS